MLGSASNFEVLLSCRLQVDGVMASSVEVSHHNQANVPYVMSQIYMD